MSQNPLRSYSNEYDSSYMMPIRDNQSPVLKQRIQELESILDRNAGNLLSITYVSGGIMYGLNTYSASIQDRFSKNPYICIMSDSEPSYKSLNVLVSISFLPVEYIMDIIPIVRFDIGNPECDGDG